MCWASLESGTKLFLERGKLPPPGFSLGSMISNNTELALMIKRQSLQEGHLPQTPLLLSG